MLRFYSQNVHGLKMGSNCEELDSILQSLKENNVGIFGLAESNVEFNHPWIRNKYNQEVRSVWTQAKSAMATSKTEWEGNYKPGGTVTTATGLWTSSVV